MGEDEDREGEEPEEEEPFEEDEADPAVGPGPADLHAAAAFAAAHGFAGAPGPVNLHAAAAAAAVHGQAAVLAAAGAMPIPADRIAAIKAAQQELKDRARRNAKDLQLYVRSAFARRYVGRTRAECFIFGRIWLRWLG